MHLGKLFFLSLFSFSVHAYTTIENQKIEELANRMTLPAAQVILGAVVSACITGMIVDTAAHDDIAHKLESINEAFNGLVERRWGTRGRAICAAVGLTLLTLIARIDEDSSAFVKDFTKSIAAATLVTVPLLFVHWLLQPKSCDICVYVF